ncbi:MAG: sugar transferase [Tenuifilum sp.]|uniref:sugar transferase n=1 Tax=Tenuifilum sp. TaxID=2760880 RepID=UPI003095405E
MYSNFFKPLFDFIIGTIALLILLPFFVFILILLLFINNGKPFFIQLRSGKNGRIFKIIKFKTMNDNRDKYGNLLPDSKRITNFGLFLRKTSLDELPQLINVIKGDMSIVGPRPLLVDYLPLYNEFQNKRHKVKPGITGWAQINGRNAISWDEKFKLDVYYVENISFWLDLNIILKTLYKVLGQKNVNNKEGETMELFKGN